MPTHGDEVNSRHDLVVIGAALSAPPEVIYPTVRARARQVSEQLRQAALERIRERGVHLVTRSARSPRRSLAPARP